MPCQADQTIEDTLRSISIPVTTINHEPTVNVTIFHYPRLRLNQEAFEEKVESIAKEFGFLCSPKSNYLFYDDDNEHGVIGDVLHLQIVFQVNFLLFYLKLMILYFLKHLL